MAFALTINQLIPALKQPGCPICNLQRSTVQRFLVAFLQENLMDQTARQVVLDSLGFCPDHTFLLVSMEMRSDGDPLGTVILHEQINGRVQTALRDWNALRSQGWQEKIPIPFKRPIRRIHQTTGCPICAAMLENNQRGLAALMEELGKGSQELIDLYSQGNGLCLAHLRVGLEEMGTIYPIGAEYLIQNALQRLETQQGRMQEYLRKHNLSYQNEQITLEEERAWRESLSFFSGYSPDAFDPFSQPPV
jgi:hypothetical protein